MTQEEIDLEQEYKTRELCFVTLFRGCFHPSDEYPHFSPRLFIGTREQYDNIIDTCMGREDEFKITGTVVFNSLDEYNNLKK